MKLLGETIEVTTSTVFKGELGTVIEQSRTTLTVDFDGRIGKYDLFKNEFIVYKNFKLERPVELISLKSIEGELVYAEYSERVM
ncbi:hypothetical protein EVB32_031 [Rhizobium phage RHph_TM39]|uniref:Uncharacterized protein n=1 Tax=Rhizobium phage RHph_TM30 TaxID=2509764 RepID=A0A7S5UXF1_9CAUD|nr:hypothetical protein PQC16_gp031 [Rhizobium phage RHph_TM30]QIG72227.1 hypothetical protein EVB96_031 [Rhizobium phage RHph_TM3_3_6]QIG77019.1 hypothetical protein EVB32_031 [Rhizobium phage RHph_TM39]QIG77359.1 hypothetical protein EVB61_031 [Rhizobium phage RHph_TM21B]QIG77618.1 hypothetical protein EVB64_031 [Rhizobium phage RHph_TM61]QIG71138.1 hypothetical protein EVB93_031 [Rhizobium phage RHph_TM30]